MPGELAGWPSREGDTTAAKIGRNREETSRFMKVLKKKKFANRAEYITADEEACGASGNAARAKREAHDGKQLPSVGTGTKNGKTTISGSHGPSSLAHIEYSAHDNPRIP